MRTTIMAARVEVHLCSRSFDYPDECPCCGADPDGELLVPFSTNGRMIAEDTAKALLFPYCRRCIEHVRLWESASMMSTLIMLVGIIVALYAGAVVRPLLGFIVFAATITLASIVSARRRRRARESCRAACASPARAAGYHGWSGSTTTLSFGSAAYTARFALHNANNLVNVSGELRAFLGAFEIARKQVPTPALATRTLPRARTADDWLVHIRAIDGRIARRAALSRALAAVAEPLDREALVLAVSRAELEPVLRGLDRLDPSGAVRRLHHALELVRSDNLPEALREAELHELEARLQFMTQRETFPRS